MARLSEKEAQLFLDRNFGSVATIREGGTRVKSERVRSRGLG